MAFKTIEEIPEGYVMNSIMYSRMIKSNQNILGAVIGKTGTGKSWFCMSLAESWYKYKFKKQFPIENVCFSIDDMLKRLTKGNLQRGELLILEEGGVNMGNLDFQNKIAKTFNYVLQSFRSLNVGLIINLPVYSMLNRQTRMLMHFMFQTMEIDRKTNKVVIKPFLLDTNQVTGKEYKHYPKVEVNGMYEQIQRITYYRPSETLVEQYEVMKRAFVLDTVANAEEVHKKKVNITEMQAIVYYLRAVRGLGYKEIAEMFNFLPATVSKHYMGACNNGLTVDLLPKYRDFYKKYEVSTVSPTIVPPIS